MNFIGAKTRKIKTLAIFGLLENRKNHYPLRKPEKILKTFPKLTILYWFLPIAQIDKDFQR